MNASSVQPGQVWERLVRRKRLQDSSTRLLLVVGEPFDNVVWDAPDEDGVSWAANHPQVELLDLESGVVQRTNVASLLEGNWFLVEAAPGETGNSSKPNDLELPIGSPRLSEA